MSEQRYPQGWDEERIRQVLEHYETQSDEAAEAEDERAFGPDGEAVVEVPTPLLPVIREIIARYQASCRP